MDDVLTLTCQSCYYVGETDELDGFYYCRSCGEQNLDVVDTGAEEGEGIGGGIYLASHQRSQPIPAKPVSQYNTQSSQSSYRRKLGLEADEENVDRSQFDEASPWEPEDFGSEVVCSEDYHKEIRLRYVLGLQLMIQLQCEALVKEFKVTPLICGLVGPIWLRFVSKTGVFDDDWADNVIHDSEMQREEEPEDYKIRAQYKSEPHNNYGQRAALIWFREAIMPSDLIKWAREGKLPYFSAFVVLESRLGEPSTACPISSSAMFRPQRALSVHKLELYASSFAQFIGLELPPVNFYALAYRYLVKLSLPVEKILPYACRIYEWSVSPDLWLSLSNDYFRLPTHVCVVSILVVTIRILYNIHGYGEWEKSLSHNDSAKDSAKEQQHELDCTGLLQHLHAVYNEIADIHEYSKDLPTYLKYCKDVVFAGLEPSYGNHEEKNMMETLWKHYQNEENTKPSESEPEKQHDTSCNGTGLGDEECIEQISKKQKRKRECFNEPSPEDKSSESLSEAIAQLKLDMEENRFCYIAPSSVKPKHDYIHYVRKKDNGALSYVAHADYYILLRAFARVAYDDDIRILHVGVLNLERRLVWLEKRVGQCLHLKPPNVSCEFCTVRATENESGDGS
ncbi:hypothetical protein P8452_30603 [Trifolium repens]|nr:hypothetical protein P8452_30603 [Trifolium repens]